jgi:hypothetical protein
VSVPDRARALQRHEHPVARALGLVGLLVLWELLTRTGWVPALFLPSPLGVVAAGLDMLRSGELLAHVGTSLGRILVGFALGALGGVAVGLAVVFSLAEAVGNPLIAATFPIPKIALLPLLILWLGIGEASKVAVITLGVFFPMAINTYTGVRHADPLLLRAGGELRGRAVEPGPEGHAALGAGETTTLMVGIVPLAAWTRLSLVAHSSGTPGDPVEGGRVTVGVGPGRAARTPGFAVPCRRGEELR